MDVVGDHPIEGVVLGEVVSPLVCDGVGYEVVVFVSVRLSISMIDIEF